MNNKNNKYNAPSLKKQNEVLKQNARIDETIRKSNAIKQNGGLKDNPPIRPERVSNIKAVEYTNFSNLLTATYKNELQRHDLTEKTRRLILDAVIAKSNLLKHIMLVSDDYLEINTIKENDGFTTIENLSLVSNNNSERIVIKGTEFDFKELGGNSVFAQKLEDAIQDKLETKVINDLKASGTSILVSKSATIIDKILAIKEHYNNKEFVIAVGLKDYIELTNNRTEFPIKIIYVPKLYDGEVLAFIHQNVYANLVLGSVDTKKDIMTGICYVACNVLSLETYMQDVVSIELKRFSKDFTVNYSMIGTTDELNIATEPSKVTVKVSSTDSDILNTITEENFNIQLDVSEYTEVGVYNKTPEVTINIDNVTIDNISEVKLTVTKND